MFNLHRVLWITGFTLGFTLRSVNIELVGTGANPPERQPLIRVNPQQPRCHSPSFFLKRLILFLSFLLKTDEIDILLRHWIRNWMTKTIRRRKYSLDSHKVCAFANFPAINWTQGHSMKDGLICHLLFILLLFLIVVVAVAAAFAL